MDRGPFCDKVWNLAIFTFSHNMGEENFSSRKFTKCHTPPDWVYNHDQNFRWLLTSRSGRHFEFSFKKITFSKCLLTSWASLSWKKMLVLEAVDFDKMVAMEIKLTEKPPIWKSGFFKMYLSRAALTRVAGAVRAGLKRAAKAEGGNSNGPSNAAGSFNLKTRLQTGQTCF